MTGGGGAESPPPTAAFASPAGPIATSAAIVELRVQPVTADRIELWRDGAFQADVTRTLRLAWDASATADGTYAWTIRAYSGTRWTESGPLAVTIDRTPPAIAATSPARGETVTPPLRNVTVTFTEPLDAASVEASDFSISSGSEPVSFDASLSADRRAVTLTPRAPFAAPPRLDVRVTGALADAAGNALPPEDAARLWSFDVVSLWQVAGGGPVNPGGAFFDPVLFSGPGGVPHVLLPDTSRFITKLSGAAWTAVSPSLIGYYLPAAASDGTAIWTAVPVASGDATVERYTPGFGWWPMGRSLGTGGRVRDVAFAFPPDGPLIAWDETDAAFQTLAHVARWSDAASGWAPLTLPPELRVGGVSRLLSAGSVTVVAITDGTTLRVASISGADVHTFAALPANAMKPRIALGPAGELYGAEVYWGWPRRELRVYRWNGGAWDALGVAGWPMESATPDYAFAADAGHLYVAWASPDVAGGPDHLYVSEWDGTSWYDRGGILNMDPAHDAQWPTLAIDGAGVPYVCWSEIESGTFGSLSDPPGGNVYVKRLVP